MNAEDGKLRKAKHNVSTANVVFICHLISMNIILLHSVNYFTESNLKRSCTKFVRMVNL